MPKTAKKVLPIKVSQKVVEEFDDIQHSEGFGNRASTFTFLVKFYQLKKQSKFEKAADDLGGLLEKIDPEKTPSLKEQLEQKPELLRSFLQLAINPSLNFLNDEPDLYENY